MSIKLREIFEDSKKITVYAQGKSLTFNREETEFNEIFEIFGLAIKRGIEMPAFGIAVDKLVKDYILRGIAIEFHFETMQSYNSMPYEALFIKLSENYCGLTIERKYAGEYQGRGYYLNLDKDVNKLIAKIKQVILAESVVC